MDPRAQYINQQVSNMLTRDGSRMRDYYNLENHMRDFGRYYDENIRSSDEMANSRSYARTAEDRIESEDELEDGDWEAFDSDELEDAYDPDDMD